VLNPAENVEDNIIVNPVGNIEEDVFTELDEILENNHNLDLTENITDSSSDISGGNTFSDIVSTSDNQSSSDQNSSDPFFVYTDYPPQLIQEFKIQEINELYSNQILQFGVTQEELRGIIEQFPVEQLYLSELNNLILMMITNLHS